MLAINKNVVDAIIIGAGISGLVCGCYLARAGLKVLVVEQHDKPGGYFTSFRRKGFSFDAAAHSFGNYRADGHVRKIFTELGVEKIVAIKRFDPSDIIIAPDFKITFWNNLNDTIADLSSVFPEERTNIIEYFKFLTSSNRSEFIKLKDKTFDHLLRSFFHDERLISALALPVLGNGGLPPSSMHAFSGAKIFSEFIMDGGYYPDGGIQNLPNALALIIKKNRGEIFYKRCATRILQENGSVIGVELDHHERLLSKYVVSACDMIQTYKTLLGENITGTERINRLNELSPSISTFILYIGIDRPFNSLPQPGTNTWYLPYYDLNEIYSRIQDCDLDRGGIFMLRVSPDNRTILALVSAPYISGSFWKQNKKRTTESFLNRIEKIIPDIRQHSVYVDAATPATLYRYTLNYNGAAFGWAKTLEQTYEPIFNRTTFISGLYQTGHWTSIAFGLPGACYSGADTAGRILRKGR